MKKFVPLFFLVLATSSNAHAFHVNALAGLNFYNTSSSVSTDSKGAFSYGATIQGGFIPGFDLETGIFLNKNETEGGGSVLAQNSFEIPLLARFTLLPILDLGAGAYYESFADEADSGGVQLTGQGVTDFGLKASLRFRVPVLPTLAFLVDASYKFGLKDIDSSAEKASQRTYALMAGASFGF